MLYRRHRDVHSQLPPDELSVSLNILALSPHGRVPRPVSVRPRALARSPGSSTTSRSRRWSSSPPHLGGEQRPRAGRRLSPRAIPSERIRFAALRGAGAGLSRRPGRAARACTNARPRRRRLRRRDGGPQGPTAAERADWIAGSPVMRAPRLQRQPVGVEQGLGIAGRLADALRRSARGRPGRRCSLRNPAPSADRRGRPHSAGRPPPPSAAAPPRPRSRPTTPWSSQLATCWLEIRQVARSSIRPTSWMSGTFEQPTPWSIQRTT